MTETTLEAAINLVRQGQKTQARPQLEALLSEDETNETAWLWLAECAETREQGIQTLEACLKILPHAARARAALELLLAEIPDLPRRGMLADRLISAHKNVKSQPRYRLQSGKSTRTLSRPDLTRLRRKLPREWLPSKESESQPAPEEIGSEDVPYLAPPVVLADTPADPADASAAAITTPAAGEIVPPDQLLDRFSLPRYSMSDFRPREKSSRSPDDPPAVDPFTISPELLTPEDIYALEENLGAVPVARRRISLLQNPGEAWRSLSESQLPEIRRAAPPRPEEEIAPAGRVLGYGLLIAGALVLLAVFVFVVAFILGAL